MGSGVRTTVIVDNLADSPLGQVAMVTLLPSIVAIILLNPAKTAVHHSH